MEVDEARALTLQLTGKALPKNRERVAVATYAVIRTSQEMVREKATYASDTIESMLRLCATTLVECAPLMRAKERAKAIAMATAYIVEACK